MISPAAEEVTDINLQASLGELQKIVEETDNLQVIVASANPEELVGVLGKERCRVAPGQTYVR